MLAVIRQYEPVSPAVARSFIAARDRADSLFRGVPGLHGAVLIRTRDGLALVALGTDEWCLAECGRRFRAWADDGIPGFRAVSEAAIRVGEVIGSSGVLSTPPGSDQADSTDEE